MTRRRAPWFGLIFGVGGIALLLGLGLWQGGKYLDAQDVVAALEDRMSAAPLTLGVDPLPESPDYRRARAEGAFGEGEALKMGVTHQRQGGNVLISPFQLVSGERILVERGFAPEGRRGEIEPPRGVVEIVGVLVDPQEVGPFTPDPDFEAGVIFARDVPALAAHFEASPVLLVLDRRVDPAARFPEPIPVEVSYPTNHFGYAVTWFSLAAIWTAMTAFLFMRGRKSDG